MPVPIMQLPPTPRTSLDERPEILPTLIVTKTREFKGSYNLSRRAGSGAWSDVYLAEEASPSSSAPPDASTLGLTPPPSPGMTARSPSRLLAVKKPSHKAARRVLSREARVLSYLQSDPTSSSFVITFHGLDAENDSLVLDFAPLTLKRLAEQGLNHAQRNISTKTMFDPVIGESTWKHYARSLISGLAWLHSRGVAHGDVKADNILLKPRKSIGPSESTDSMDVDSSDDALSVYQPLLCDFSSARLIGDCDDSTSADADDAITTTYASPELLASFKFTTGTLEKPVDRQKADVWAMAVCLVVAAVGVEPYAEASMAMMKLHLAKHGDVLGSVRNNSGQATRIMKGGFVAKTAAMGLAREPGPRVTAAEWKDRLDL